MSMSDLGPRPGPTARGTKQASQVLLKHDRKAGPQDVHMSS
jgi:hypothetical protein